MQEVYDFIISDLKLALGHLPAAPSLNLTYRPVEAATNALLARVYLYMNNMTEAFRYADASLKLYNELIDYNTVPPNASFPGTPRHSSRFAEQRSTAGQISDQLFSPFFMQTVTSSNCTICKMT